MLGINIFLDGFVPTENLRFRETALVFKVSETAEKVVGLREQLDCLWWCECLLGVQEEERKKMRRYKYPELTVIRGLVFIRLSICLLSFHLCLMSLVSNALK